MSNDLTTIIKEYAPENIIDAWYEANNVSRSRLGLSQCGHECPRWLWYCHQGRTGQAPPGRILRLFQLGNIIEDQVVVDLKSAGYAVCDMQKEVSFEYDDTIIRGHIDGIIAGLTESSRPHLLEIKTSSDKRFMLLKKSGYEEWDVKYKFQIHAYMLGLKLDRCLVVVYNKNTSEVYTERINLDKEYIVSALQRVFNIIMQKTIPERKCPRADWYKAKQCIFYCECFKNAKM